MNKVIITIFAILFVQFVGLPSTYDRAIYTALSLLLIYFVFNVLRDIRKKEEQPAIKTKKPSAKKTTKKEEATRKTTQLISPEEKESINEAVKKSKT